MSLFQKLYNKLSCQKMATENQLQQKIKEEEMTEMEPAKIFGFSETAEMKEEERKPVIRSFVGFPYIPPNDNQETVLQMLKREKEEDKEFRRMIVL